jgi:hypothetical protein
MCSFASARAAEKWARGTSLLAECADGVPLVLAPLSPHKGTMKQLRKVQLLGAE